jgi:uncharacterized membrane protein
MRKRKPKRSKERYNDSGTLPTLVCAIYMSSMQLYMYVLWNIENLTESFNIIFY